MIEDDKGQIVGTRGSEIPKHMQTSEHSDGDFEYSILQIEDNWLKRGIKEAIEIQRRSPTLNADEGRYRLPKIWTNAIQIGKDVKYSRHDDNITTSNAIAPSI